MKLSQFDKTMVAMAFAEAGEPDTAREFLGEPAGPRKAHCPAVKKKPLGAMLFSGVARLSSKRQSSLVNTAKIKIAISKSTYFIKYPDLFGRYRL